jgi:hypothetical protein
MGDVSKTTPLTPSAEEQTSHCIAMEARVCMLEAKVEKLQAVVTSLKTEFMKTSKGKLCF